MASFYDQESDLSNFVISFTPDPKGDFAVFARAYALAADRLAAQLLEAPRFSDYEAYPVMFLYRHAFELSLKHVIYASAVLSRSTDLDGCALMLKDKHDLVKLSKTAGDLVERLFSSDNSLRALIAHVQQTAQELAEIDPGSYSYRYPVDTHGRHSTKRHQVVNLGGTARHLSRLLNDLEAVHFGMEIEAEAAQQARAALQSSLLQTHTDSAAKGGGLGAVSS